MYKSVLAFQKRSVTYGEPLEKLFGPDAGQNMFSKKSRIIASGLNFFLKYLDRYMTHYELGKVAVSASMES
jgi:hypothetical protein